MQSEPVLYNPRFTDRLAFDIALTLEGSGDDLPDILKRHQMATQDLADLNTDPLFLKRVGELRTEIKDKGISFKMKARAQAEELLTTSWMIIHSPDVSAAVKADLIKSTVKWAGYEPKNAELADGGGAGGVQIMINMSGAAPQVIEGVAVERAKPLGKPPEE